MGIEALDDRTAAPIRVQSAKLPNVGDKLTFALAHLQEVNKPKWTPPGQERPTGDAQWDRKDDGSIKTQYKIFGIVVDPGSAVTVEFEKGQDGAEDVRTERPFRVGEECVIYAAGWAKAYWWEARKAFESAYPSVTFGAGDLVDWFFEGEVDTGAAQPRKDRKFHIMPMRDEAQGMACIELRDKVKRSEDDDSKAALDQKPTSVNLGNPDNWAPTEESPFPAGYEGHDGNHNDAAFAPTAVETVESNIGTVTMTEGQTATSWVGQIGAMVRQYQEPVRAICRQVLQENDLPCSDADVNPVGLGKLDQASIERLHGKCAAYAATMEEPF